MRPFGKEPKSKSVRAKTHEPKADNIILRGGVGHGLGKPNKWYQSPRLRIWWTLKKWMQTYLNPSNSTRVMGARERGLLMIRVRDRFEMELSSRRGVLRSTCGSWFEGEIVGVKPTSHIGSLDRKCLIYKTSPTPTSMRPFGKEPKSKSVRAKTHEPKADNIILRGGVGHGLGKPNIMFPWFAFGHMTPYLHLANKLAAKGHRITFLLPKKAQKQLEHLNLFPDNIVFYPLTIPHVDGLPAGAETFSDIPMPLWKFLPPAIDLTRHQVEAAVRDLSPDLILFDIASWVPEMAKEYRVKSMLYNVLSATSIAHDFVPGGELGVPAPGYPSSKLLYRIHDAHALLTFSVYYKRFSHRLITGLMNCDFISIRTCKEIEGKFCDYIERQYQKKVLLTGPMFPELDKSKPLEYRWSHWLSGFGQGSVVFCALGSQVTLEKDQFQELCLGMELTGLPFLVAVTPPQGAKTIQEALPEGFEERVKGRGVVWGEWVQQPLILAHPSVGCFVSHCGFGSMWESLMSGCQIVLLPFLADQVLNTRLMTEELEVSVEVKREETGWFLKESLSVAVTSVMDQDSEIGNLVRRNHSKLKEVLVSDGLLTGYTDKFVDTLENIVNDTKLK